MQTGGTVKATHFEEGKMSESRTKIWIERVNGIPVAWEVLPPPEAGPCTAYVRADIANEMLRHLKYLSGILGKHFPHAYIGDTLELIAKAEDTP